MGEGGLYAPDHAALALRQAAGDTFEAAFLLRAHRASLPRIASSEVDEPAPMRVVRRISSAFKDIPGGQILGPTSDYTLRLLELDPIEEPEELRQIVRERLLQGAKSFTRIPDQFPRIVEMLRREGLVEESHRSEEEPFDITRRSTSFPAPRSASLQTLARGETGGLLLLAYSSMRGYGQIHPTLAELRVGYRALSLRHPSTGEPFIVGEILVTEADVVSRFTNPSGEPRFHLGCGMCFGQNEIKAISMAVPRSLPSRERAVVASGGPGVSSFPTSTE